MLPCGPHLTPLATGSLERSLLVFSTPGGLPATTFRACSSPAPTPVKPQPAPAILSQESVHTMLSITHRTRKRPSTDPRTTHGPHMDIYYMFGHFGWVQFSNRVSTNTHKEFALEILMTMAPILDEGVPSLSFQLEGIQQVVPYEHIRGLLGFL
jgi:hypothetical protein